MSLGLEAGQWFRKNPFISRFHSYESGLLSVQIMLNNNIFPAWFGFAPWLGVN